MKPPLPYSSTRSRTEPKSATSGIPSRRAFRSQRAESTAAIAVEAIPGRPMFRTAATILSQARGTAVASSPQTSGASRSATSAAAEASA